MIIKLEKFGSTLTSRQEGREAHSAFLPVLKELSKGEIIKVDFKGVNTLCPAWADEFFTPLKKFGKVIFKKSDNLSVRATMNFLNREFNK